MPGAVIADAGLRAALTAVLTPRTFVRLFRNDVAVLPASPLAAYQACLFPGYADMEVTGLFTGVSTDMVGRATAAAYNLTWTRGAGGVPETVYGWVWYYGPDPTGTVIAGRRLTVPQLLTTDGQTVVLSVIAYLLRG